MCTSTVEWFKWLESIDTKIHIQVFLINHLFLLIVFIDFISMPNTTSLTILHYLQYCIILQKWSNSWQSGHFTPGSPWLDCMLRLLRVEDEEDEDVEEDKEDEEP